MMQFKATDDQVKQIMINAVKSSKPVGMGFMHYDARTEFKPEMFELQKDGHNPGAFLDYVQGRMVKLQLWYKGNGVWQTHDRAADPEYQSWCSKYKDYRSLLASVPGVEIIQ